MNNPIEQQSATDRRSRTRKEIKQLIAERNEVLSLYCKLADYDNVEISSDDIDPDVLREFCQLLIDYIATGHFELYRRISEGEERRQDILSLAGNIYPKIQQTTQIAVDFNDLFDGGNEFSHELRKQLPQYLSKLGEELANRIELEDRLINTLLSPKPVYAESVQ
ncbi:MAG: sigma D regulator [Gammaproteobacteria bacterium]|nr:sigma D regulator [Gammaproteobacteria bacterium]